MIISEHNTSTMWLEKNRKEQKIVVQPHDRENRKRAGESFMKNKEGFMNIQLFAEAEGATTPTTDTPTNNQIDYESEYKKVLAERDSYKAEAEKQKGLKDKYASENADYKKKEIDKMTDDEKRQKEYQDIMESNKKMEAELRTMKLEKELLSNGFTGEESEKLINGNFAVKDIADIIKAKVEEAVKSTKAELLKGSTTTPPMGSPTTNGNGKTKAEQIAEKRFGVDTSKIKEFYKKV